MYPTNNRDIGFSTGEIESTRRLCFYFQVSVQYGAQSAVIQKVRVLFDVLSAAGNSVPRDICSL